MLSGIGKWLRDHPWGAVFGFAFGLGSSFVLTEAGGLSDDLHPLFEALITRTGWPLVAIGFVGGVAVYFYELGRRHGRREGAPVIAPTTGVDVAPDAGRGAAFEREGDQVRAWGGGGGGGQGPGQRGGDGGGISYTPDGALQAHGGKAADAQAMGAHYDARDRQRIRDALREIKEIMVRLAEANTELHAITSRIRQGLGTPDAAAASVSLSALQDELSATRVRIATRFVHGQDDGNEIHAILGNRDVLNLVVVACENALKATDAAATSPAYLREVFEPHLKALDEARSQLAEWISHSLQNIERRRREIGGD
jgi:hypothetical protein